MRISEQQRYYTVNRRVDEAKNDNTKALGVLSTQKNINSIADDPVGVTRSIQEKNTIRNISQYEKNLNFSKGFLLAQEGAIGNMTDRLIRARELAVAMANDTYDAESRSATAAEVRQILNGLIEQGNTRFNDRYVFSGFRAQTPALSADGSYLGDDGAIFVPVGREDFRQINIQARHLFTASPDEKEMGRFGVIDTVKGLISGLEDSQKDLIYKTMSELDYHIEKMTSYQAKVGALYESLSTMEDQLNYQKIKHKKQLSKIEDADVYRASSDFKKTETLLQSTLLASNKLLQPSLLNFLK